MPKGEGQWPTRPHKWVVSCIAQAAIQAGVRRGNPQEAGKSLLWPHLAKQQGVPQEPPIVGHFRPGSWGFCSRQKIKIPNLISSVFKGSVSQCTNNVP